MGMGMGLWQLLCAGRLGKSYSPAQPSASFASQTVILTGANGGLGKEIVRHLIPLGASKVILGCRSHSRVIQSIKAFVNHASMLPQLDAVYGTERTLAVNNIGTFLLASQLIPKLKQTARVRRATPRMTTVASALYDVAKCPKHGDVELFAWFADESHVGGMNQ
ncbi:hypothetical protein B0T24DRAFT_648602 [Lasiosphaeria ovina]|uniref:Ketoreductase (KR) domain-containing protein n=1 Tax=Lasiosphaeria ovina TaxID=92902 RepID=A0AAE0NAH4_9PEZI|nr:hypothetical protein B0T24DRAFT_648602 [Lasiosphaeria ovina]